VLRVETDAEPFRMAGLFEQLGEVLELVADAGALAGGVLDDEQDVLGVGGRFDRLAQTLGDEGERLL
jgi:hypothetical protein